MFKTGAKPGKGWYTCIKCGEDLYLNEDTDRLPPCVKCYGVIFLKPKLICRNCGRRSVFFYLPSLVGWDYNDKEIKFALCKYCKK